MKYFGIRPQRWGTGLACSVLQLLCAELAADGFIDAQLLVYAWQPASRWPFRTTRQDRTPQVKALTSRGEGITTAKENTTQK
jgi:hypothetical protein